MQEVYWFYGACLKLIHKETDYPIETDLDLVTPESVQNIRQYIQELIEGGMISEVQMLEKPDEFLILFAAFNICDERFEKILKHSNTTFGIFGANECYNKTKTCFYNTKT